MESILNMWHPSWAEVPWKAFNDPRERFQVMPTFVMGEFVFIFLSIILFFHALAQGRLHLMVWAGSFITGVANDAIFMMLPLVDNFWQAQACVNLTPRMPLYIPCAYNVFMYTSTMSVWRLKLPLLAEAALTGIMGEMIYAPYDITGAKFIWWTWHSSDASVRNRNLGAPVGSTVWVITFTASFQLLLRLLVLNRVVKNNGQKHIGMFRIASTLLMNALLCTPLMMVQMAFLQLISGESQGLPTNRSFGTVLLLYGAVISFGLWNKYRHSQAKGQRQRRPPSLPELEESEKNALVPRPDIDAVPKVAITLYFLFLSLIMMFGTPENHVSTGIHQTLGPCGVEAVDFAGHLREEYVCLSNHSEDWNAQCDAAIPVAPNFSEWYTICGEPHSNFGLWLGVLMALGALGITTYNMVLGKRHFLKTVLVLGERKKDGKETKKLR
ncbi:uncharacterized protein LOC131884517 [Tigriopus californicus]|uniref:uncharacterized protein LOC131884517 n=1 Tax=Tigriopus californicus TaxID=6832 RepID=UPI0027DA8411|nr:uncharacterized protein LOC131884517 [Tigriopus californicus]